MRFIYLGSGAVYCRWGESKEQWFLIFDPACSKGRWFP